MVVFMRTSTVGAAISSVVFDAKEGSNELVAAVGPSEKIAYYCEPGEHLFMVIAENADFMEANLEAGKIYYAIITPRMGVWKARFSLHPFKQVNSEEEFTIGGEKLAQWLKSCKYVVPNEDIQRYAVNSAGDIQKRRENYEAKWDSMLEEDKQWRRLEPQDGVTEPIF